MGKGVKEIVEIYQEEDNWNGVQPLKTLRVETPDMSYISNPFLNSNKSCISGSTIVPSH